jgi:hypothetical protein
MVRKRLFTLVELTSVPPVRGPRQSLALEKASVVPVEVLVFKLYAKGLL